MEILSPQFAMIVGPGYCLLINMQSLSPFPSGLQVVFVISREYSTVLPVFGHFVSKSVAMLKPFPQQARVRGPLEQEESGTLVEVGATDVEDALTEEVAVVPCLFTRFNPLGLPSGPQRIWLSGRPYSFRYASAAVKAVRQAVTMTVEIRIASNEGRRTKSRSEN